MMALSCPFKEDHQVLSCFMPLSLKMHTLEEKKEEETNPTNNKGNILPLSFGVQKCIHTPDFFFYVAGITNW